MQYIIVDMYIVRITIKRLSIQCIYIHMYLARYDVECKRYKPNFKSITHLSNVKIRVVHIHYKGKAILGNKYL